MPVEERARELADLLTKAQRGDQNALNLLCKELEKQVRGYFWVKFRDNDLVDDLAQETYLRLLKSLSTIREPMKLRSFVAKVAVHVTQDYFRGKYREKEEELEPHLLTVPASKGELGRGSGPAALDDQAVQKVDLERALAELSDKARQIILLRAEGHKYEEISAQVGLTVSGVKMQVKRNLEKLKTALLSVTFLAVAATTILRVLNAGG
jgi:RNA polymerase sigma-70 factor (ECF subfamily)